MKAPKTKRTETAGQNRVIADFEDLGWAPIPNSYHDLGTDLLIGVRDARGFERGLVVGAQVKAGPSYFGEPVFGSSGETSGWWYSEDHVSHFDDWVIHPFPHLVVLHDPATRTSYWVHVTPDKCERTGQGCKILVPRAQIVCQDQFDALYEVANRQKIPWLLQQNAFEAGAANLPPGARLRYALLIPKLIAPHPNAGHDRSLEPEEAIAILSKRDMRQLAQFAEKDPNLRAFEKLARKKDWRWRLVHAFHQYVSLSDLGSLVKLLPNVPLAGDRAAVRVIVATALIAMEQLEDALTYVENPGDEEELSPIDYAWLLAQRARVKAEIGRVDEARDDATSAIRQIRGTWDDPTAALLFAASATLLFLTDFGNPRSPKDGGRTAAGLLRDAVNTRADASVWGQGTALAALLSETNHEAFKAWANSNESIRLTDNSDDSIHGMLWLSSVAADQHRWSHLLGDIARFKLLRDGGRMPSSSVRQWLHALRISGQDDDLKLGATYFLRNGPLDALRAVVDAASPETINRTNALATLKLWSVGADVTSPEIASAAALWCLSAVGDSKFIKTFRERYHPTFLLPAYAVDGLEELLPVASSTVHDSVATFLAGFVPGSIIEAHVGTLALRTSPEALQRIGFDKLRTKACEMQDARSRARFLSALQKAGDEKSATLLVEQATNGDWASVPLVLDGRLSSRQCSDILNYLSGRVDEIVQKVPSHSSGDPDTILQLTYFAIKHKSQDAWSKSLSVFQNQKVPTNLFGHALHLIANLLDELPSTWTAQLRESIAVIASPRFHHPLMGPVSGGPKHLAIALEKENRNQADAINLLLAGRNDGDRELAAVLLGRGFSPSSRVALHFLLADTDASVRAAASRAVVRLSAKESEFNCATLIEAIAADDGIETKMALLDGLTKDLVWKSPQLMNLVALLRQHVSFRIRSLVGKLMDEASIEQPIAP